MRKHALNSLPNQDGLHKSGDIRSDGYVFREYQFRWGKYYEHWMSPEYANKERERKSKWTREMREKAKSDPALLEQLRSYGRNHMARMRREKPHQIMFHRARRRARERGFDFNIEQCDIQIPEFCPVLGLRLELGDGVATDQSPELDRIDNAKGYVKGNVMVISRKANRIKNDATPDELMLVAVFYSKLKSKAMEILERVAA